MSVVFADLVGSTAQAERARHGGRSGDARCRTTHASVASSSVSAARWRSSSATPSSRSSARRSSTRTTPSAPCARRSRSGTRSPGRTSSLRIAVNTGEALVTLDARPPKARAWSPATSSTRQPGSSPALRSTASSSGRHIPGDVARDRVPGARAARGEGQDRARSQRGRPSRRVLDSASIWSRRRRPRSSGREQEVSLLRDTLARARRERSRSC